MNARDRSRERGVALILVLWVFMTLGVVALDFSRYMRDDAMAALNLADETRGYYLALAGMNRAIYDATREREEQLGAAGEAAEADAGNDQAGDGVPDVERITADGQWHEGTFGGGTWAVRMTDEAGRVSLNKAPEAIIRRIVTSVLSGGNVTEGIDVHEQRDIDTIVDSIRDWRDCDSLTRVNGAEDDYYLGLRRPYHAKNGFFDSVQELLSVRGVTPDLFYGRDGMPGLVDVFSAQGRSEHLNPEAVTVPVAQALLGIDRETAESFLAGRAEDPLGIALFFKQQLAALDPSLEQFVQAAAAETVRIEARGDAHAARNQASVYAVVQIAGGDYDGPRVLQWIDRAPVRGDGPPPGEDKGATS